MERQVNIGSFVEVEQERNGFDLTKLNVTQIQRISALVNANSNDPLVAAVRGIRLVNDATRQAIRDENGQGVERELRLYLTSNGTFPDTPFQIAQELATLLDMKVCALDVPVVFRPHLQLAPLDEIRGRISLDNDGPIVLDCHRLDDQMQCS